MKDVEVRYYNVWHHLATQEEPSASQLWHRDREDLQILKVFIYLTDVSVENGPFTYAPQTHLLGKMQSESEFFLEKNVKRTNDDMMNNLVNKNQWIQATAPKYTLIFADTHGFHKGGYVKEGERLLFTAMYVSPGCERHYFDK